MTAIEVLVEAQKRLTVQICLPIDHDVSNILYLQEVCRRKGLIEARDTLFAMERELRKCLIAENWP